MTEHATTRTGHCMFPAAGSHTYCGDRGYPCACPCHSDPEFLAREEALYAEVAKTIHPEPVADGDDVRT